MSILIKGVPMPVDCNECPCSQWESVKDGADQLYCLVYLKPVEAMTKPDFCGMVEVDDAYYSHHPQENIYAKLP